MTATGNLLRLSRDMQSLALVGENVKLAKKKKKKPKKLVSVATKNIIGIELIKAQAKLSSGL